MNVVFNRAISASTDGINVRAFAAGQKAIIPDNLARSLMTEGIVSEVVAAAAPENKAIPKAPETKPGPVAAEVKSEPEPVAEPVEAIEPTADPEPAIEVVTAPAKGRRRGA